MHGALWLSSTLPVSNRRAARHQVRGEYASTPPPAGDTQPRRRKVVLYDLHDRQVPYQEAWAWQKRLVDAVHEMSSSTAGGVAGIVLLLQHPPVYTLGAGSTEAHLKFDPASPPLPLFRTERGGEATYHGPGQLVMYPLLDLRRFKTDLHWYLRCLEEVVIRALEEVSGLEGGREEGLTGVWAGGKKVAAIGVRATRWITYHGLALNVTTDLAPFGDIVPCGIADRGVASVAQLLLDAAAAEDPLAGEDLLADVWSLGAGSGAGEAQRRLLEEYRYGLVGAFEEVFGLEVEAVEGDAAEGQLWELMRGGMPKIEVADMTHV